MRGRILDSLFRRMGEDEDPFFLTGDMGIQLVEKFQEAFPRRYLNVGIAEQNLVAISAGLCNLGYRPFAYTISQFMTLRCYEQIRNDVSLHAYPITLLGTATGFDNAPLGPSHHVLDDWGAIRNLPGIDIYCPSAVPYAETLVDKVLAAGRPAYIRIPKGQFERPSSLLDTVYLEGRGAGDLLVSYGGCVQSCLEVQGAHPEVSVLAIHRLRPLETEAVEDALRRHPRAFVVEDHFPATGLFNTLCQFCVERGVRTGLRSVGTLATYPLTVGASARYYHEAFGIDVRGIERAIWG
ncbi:MAG: hypothetical protein HY722_11560 [Planctomycetes bacterium]|nr:hypothetical protein [Planctomycetota bacterium]